MDKGRGTRIERDSMGEVEVPEEAYYGASTRRAVINFPISGLRFPRRFIRALGVVKRCAAEVNGELGLLEAGMAAIRLAELLVGMGLTHSKRSYPPPQKKITFPR